MLRSWLPVAADSDFSIHNLPFGAFSIRDEHPDPMLGVAIGDQIVHLAAADHWGLFAGIDFNHQVLYHTTLNALMAEGPEVRSALRTRIQTLLTEGSADQATVEAYCLVPQASVQMHLPFQIGDYTDFYASEEHATNVGKMFRDPANALLPNWKHLPVAYHGRSSSIVISGTDFRRPKGQIKPNDAEPPIFSPTRALDFELEIAMAIGLPNPMGEPITTADAQHHIFGYLLFNDWSARDIQKWEYVPLGPFLGKNFCSSVSPWVVTPEALEPFLVPGPKQSPEVLPYLQYTGNQHFDIHLEVAILPAGATEETVVCRSNAQHLYWNWSQKLAHHTINGCPMRTGDLLASGTISGATPDSFGSMQELTWGGKNPLQLADGSERKFLLDGDTVIMRAYAERDGVRVGFGSVRGTVLP